MSTNGVLTPQSGRRVVETTHWERSGDGDDNGMGGRTRHRRRGAGGTKLGAVELPGKTRIVDL